MDVLGETEDDNPNILIAVDTDTAAYKQDSVREESFLNFASVNGSKTGNVSVPQMTEISLTNDCKLETKSQ